MPSRYQIGLIGAIAAACGAGMAAGQDYPYKAIRILTTETGSGNDFLARLTAQSVAPSLKQPVIVDNRPLIAAELVAKAPPDGYTLLVYGPPFWLAPYLRDQVPYDPVKDFSPVILLGSSPNIVVLHPSVPAATIKELIVLAKLKPGELNYGSGGSGAANHLSVELFKAMAGVNIVRVPYKGASPALVALVAGQLQVMFPVVTSGMPYVKSGQLKALAVTTARPTTLAPGLPTVAAAGLPGYEAAAAFGMFAPAKTPAALVNRLNREIGHTFERPDVKEKLFNAGVDPGASTPAELAVFVKSDMTRMGKVIKDAGIRGE